MSELLEKVREILQEAVTADNTEVMAKISKELDVAEQSYQDIAKENVTLKDRIVDMVKTTISSKEPPKDAVVEDTPKSIEEALDEAIAKVIKERK